MAVVFLIPCDAMSVLVYIFLWSRKLYNYGLKSHGISMGQVMESRYSESVRTLHYLKYLKLLDLVLLYLVGSQVVHVVTSIQTISMI